jgi:hypothetical protein
MVTRSRTGTLRANQRYACTATTTAPPVPSSVREALWDPDWRAAMQVEFDALQANRTWSLLPRPPGVNVIGKWVFKNKFLPDGSLQRRKAMCVVRGFQLRPYFLPHHQAGDHSHRSSSHRVAQLACTSVRVKNAFLHDELSERVYRLQPVGFIDEQHPQHVCLLSKSLYGFKQAPRAWFQRFGAHLQLVGFRATQSDSSLFVYKHGGDMAYLLL